MSLDKITKNVIETDLLVIGGGIGGCLAATRAADLGLKVTLIEKSKTDRSGNAGQGLDHMGTVPNQGITTLELVKRYEYYTSIMNGEGRFADANLCYRIWDSADETKGFWMLEQLEKYGVPAKWHDGKYYFIPTYWFQGLPVQLRVHWRNVKPNLAKTVKRYGVKVLDRTMAIDLLTHNGAVVGATALNVRTGEFTVIKSRATLMATGLVARLYDPEQPLFDRYKFAYHWQPAGISGDGWAAVYRSGANLANMDLSGWHFRTRDHLAISYGNFGINEGIPAHYLTWQGEELATIFGAKMYDDMDREGKTPFYRSLEWLPDDFHKRREVAIVDEKMVSFKISEDRGFNPRTHRYEFMLNKPHNMVGITGIHIGEDFNASLKGLYAVGDCAAGLQSAMDAASSGLLAADSIKDYIKGAAEPVIDEGQVESQKQVALAPLDVKEGTNPIELESSIRNLCEIYVGQFKSEGKLNEGLRRLHWMKREHLPKLTAKNPHYLMRCMEARNILNLAELHFHAVLARKETRGNHIRRDYPDIDRSLNDKIHVQRMEKGKEVLELIEVPELKPEYSKEGI
jgi:succinate dehydrogenase/fumarate reductase flavoprotein subunit